MTNRDALILLNSTLSVGESHKPFTNTEVVKIIDKLKEKKLELKDVYGLDFDDLYKSFFDNMPSDEKNNLFIERLLRLLSREGSIAFDMMEIKKWGIDILTIFDDKYPEIFKKYLGKRAPVLLYYCGNLDLLKNDFIGFSGSRLKNLSKEDEEVTRLWAKHVVNNHYGIVSGGATGVDTFAVQEAIFNHSEFIEFLSDSMIKRLKIVQISRAIQQGKGLLLSETNPYTPFNAGMAMARNKYIYLLAKKVIVIRADYTVKAKVKTGGTWNGAIENLKSNYPRTYVIENKKSKGNTELIELGAIPIQLPSDELSSQVILGKLEIQPTKIDKEKTNLDQKMIEILKRPHTINQVNLTDKQMEKIKAIMDAISKVQTSFTEFVIDKKIYDKFYKYCYEVASGKAIQQPTLFD